MKHKVFVITAVLLCLAVIVPGLHAQYGELKIAKINRPFDTEEGGVGFQPNCTVNNNASYTISGKVTCEITDLDAMELVYEDTKSSVPFSGGNTDVEFREFVPEGNKEYDAEFTVTGPQTGDDKNKRFTTGQAKGVNPVYMISPNPEQVGPFAPEASFVELAGAESTETFLNCTIEFMDSGYVYVDSVYHNFSANDSTDIQFPETELPMDGIYTISFWALEAIGGVIISDPILVEDFSYTGITEKPVTARFDMTVDGETVHFSLPTAGQTTISVYDVTGNLITVAFVDTYNAGSHSVSWTKSGMAPGIYFVQLVAGDNKTTCKALKIN